jgi:hypothetical protein
MTQHGAPSTRLSAPAHLAVAAKQHRLKQRLQSAVAENFRIRPDSKLFAWFARISTSGDSAKCWILPDLSPIRVPERSQLIIRTHNAMLRVPMRNSKGIVGLVYMFGVFENAGEV